jgi:excisionase family DNA binding protein
MRNDTDNPEPILLSATEAAALLAISEKTLWNHTAPRGNCIPAVRFGKTLRYSREALQRWIQSQETRQNGAAVETSHK